MKSDKQIKIFDTTLRDGQQCPGAGMSFENNIEYARLACDLGIDVLEAGFPSASALDFEIVNTIAKEYGSRPDAPIIAGLCQLREEQVIKTIDALSPAIAAKKARLHTYVPVDPGLMPASLGKRSEDKEQIIRDVFRFIKMASDAGMEVQFSPEGYSRMGENFDFVTDVIRAAIDAGATVINCPDTIGGAFAFEGEEYIVNRMKRHARIIACEYPKRDITWSIHCHNDFGLAVQNSLNAVFDGPARQIEGCINGIGERAGNASLEQCIMVLKHFGDRTRDGKPFYTNIKTEKLQAISDFVNRYMLPRQPHWPVSGDNAAKHSSGGHTNAILKNPMAYQPFDPREIGKQVSFVFGPLSGGNHAKSIIETNGFVCEEHEKAEVAQFIKDKFHQRRKGITDEELMVAYFEYRQPIQIDRIDYSKSGSQSQVQFFGSFNGEPTVIHEEHSGRDSALAALKIIIEKWYGPFEVMSHRSHSDTAGADANSISTIVIVDETNQRFEGTGFDQDIEISAMRALVDAINRAYVTKTYSTRQPQQATSFAPAAKPLHVA